MVPRASELVKQYHMNNSVNQNRHELDNISFKPDKRNKVGENTEQVEKQNESEPIDSPATTTKRRHPEIN